MCGLTVEELKVRGDWASETVYVYLKKHVGARIINDMKVASALSDVREGDGLEGVA